MLKSLAPSMADRIIARALSMLYRVRKSPNLFTEMAALYVQEVYTVVCIYSKISD